jgi:hypothetical protein
LVLVSLAVQDSLVGRGFIGLEVSFVVLVSMAVQGSLVGRGCSGGRCFTGWCFSGGLGFSGGNIFVKQNTIFITTRLQSFGSDSYAH